MVLKFIAIMRAINDSHGPAGTDAVRRCRSTRRCLLGSSEDSVFGTMHSKSAAVVVAVTLLAGSCTSLVFGDAVKVIAPRSIGELRKTATLHLGKTADWVAIAPDAVWVGSTGPFAVHRIDPKTNRRVATVKLPGEPCAGLATGFGSLWVPLCGRSQMLAKVDLESNRLLNVFKIGPAAAEGGSHGESGQHLACRRQGRLAGTN